MNSRALSAYEASALGIDTKAPSAPQSMHSKSVAALRGQSIISETSAPAFEVTQKFLYQSYFSDSLGVQAILSQAPTDPIVRSTLNTQQVNGYSVGLHPASEAPVSIRFFTGGQQGSSSAYRLTPGQIVRPHGKPGETSGSFSGFEFGLPFGWLGGGSVMLVVLRTPDAMVCWNSSPEVIYHRMRLQIVAPASIPVFGSIAPNWPHRFPWPFALSSANNLSQRGQPALAVSPTKVAMRLRVADMSAGTADVRCLLYGTNDFDLDVLGQLSTPATVSCGYQDITWGTNSTYAGSTGVGTTQYQTQIWDMPNQLVRFAGDEGGALVMTSNDARLQGQYTDVVRYGRL